MTDYPRMLYAADGRTKTVYSENEEYEMGEAWERDPSDIHRMARVHSAPIDPANEIFADMVAQRVVAMMKATLEPEPAARRGRSPKSDL